MIKYWINNVSINGTRKIPSAILLIIVPIIIPESGAFGVAKNVNNDNNININKKKEINKK
jgi:hypothetical protein